jgi:Polyketide cyclase / dehydrase and lipid transport
MAKLVLLCAILPALLATAPAAARQLAPPELAKLKAGDTVITVVPDVGVADGHVEAIIDVAAPRTVVWPVLLDCARAPSSMRALKACSLLQTAPDGSWDIREHRVSWTELLPDTSSVFRSDYTKEALIRFSRVDGDLRLLEGEWRLEPWWAVPTPA